MIDQAQLSSINQAQHAIYYDFYATYCASFYIFTQFNLPPDYALAKGLGYQTYAS
jgi:hypothetical protein